MVMVIVRLLLGQNHRLRGWQAVRANDPSSTQLGSSSALGTLSVFARYPTVFKILGASSLQPVRQISNATPVLPDLGALELV